MKMRKLFETYTIWYWHWRRHSRMLVWWWHSSRLQLVIQVIVFVDHLVDFPLETLATGSYHTQAVSPLMV